MIHPYAQLDALAVHLLDTLLKGAWWGITALAVTALVAWLVSTWR